MNPQGDPRYTPPATDTPMVSKIDPKALTVAGIAMGITLLFWAVKDVLGGTGWIIMLLLMAGGGGYVFYRGRNPEGARSLEARVQQLTRNAAGQVAAAAHTPSAPPPAYSVGGTPASQPPQRPAQFPGWSTPPQAAVANPATAAIVSAALLIPSLIAYAWRYASSGFTGLWEPWWVLTGLNLYFVVCVATRSRYPGRAPLAVLLGLAGTALIALANNPSDDVNLMKMFSSTRYYDGDYYPVLPSADVMLWITRTPTLAVLLFVAAWGVARRRQSGWVLGMIPTGLLVWWSIYGNEHGFAWQGGWFQYWLLSVGVFVGGCLCCWLADLLTSGGGVNSGMPSYAPPMAAPPASPPVPPPAPPVSQQPPAHADYRAQALQHFQGHHPGGPGDAR